VTAQTEVLTNNTNKNLNALKLIYSESKKFKITPKDHKPGHELPATKNQQII